MPPKPGGLLNVLQLRFSNRHCGCWISCVIGLKTQKSEAERSWYGAKHKNVDILQSWKTENNIVSIKLFGNATRFVHGKILNSSNEFHQVFNVERWAQTSQANRHSYNVLKAFVSRRNTVNRPSFPKLLMVIAKYAQLFTIILWRFVAKITANRIP